MKRVLVTGANGFVGRSVCRALARRRYEPVGAVRRAASLASLPAVAQGVVAGDLSSETRWERVMPGIDAVVHLAARTHVLRDRATDPLSAYRQVNVRGTLQLAEAAVAAGVGRFVFVSSVKVNGEGRERPYLEGDPPEPKDAYGLSKWEAEQALRHLALRTGLDLVILRPPLVYGPEVEANFLRLLRLADLARVVPLPLGAIDNRRSLVYVENLADALGAVVGPPAASGEVFLVSDGEDLSTAELIRRLAASGGGRARLFRLPPPAVRAAARLLGRSAEMDRLLGSLTVESAKLRAVLGWQPPYTLDQGLRATAHWYRAQRRARGASDPTAT